MLFFSRKIAAEKACAAINAIESGLDKRSARMKLLVIW